MDPQTCLIEWLNLQDINTDPIARIEDVSDGIALASLFVKVDPSSAVHLGTLEEHPATRAARAHNLTLLTAAISSFLGSRARSGSLARFTPIRRSGSILEPSTPRRPSVVGPGVRHRRPPLLMFTEESVADPQALEQLVGTVLVCALQSAQRREFVNRSTAGLSDDQLEVLRDVVGKLSDDRLASLLDPSRDSLASSAPMKITAIPMASLDDEPRDMAAGHHARVREYFQGMLSEQQRELESYKEENVTLNAEVTRLLTATRKLLAVQSDLKAEKEALEARLSMLQGQLDLSSENNSTQNHLQQINAQLRESLVSESRETDAAKARLVALVSELDEAKIMATSARQQALALRSERDALRRQLDDAEADEPADTGTDARLRAKDARVSELTQSVEDLEARLVALNHVDRLPDDALRDENARLVAENAELALRLAEAPAQAFLEAAGRRYSVPVSELHDRLGQTDETLEMWERVEHVMQQVADRNSGLRTALYWFALFVVMLAALLAFNAMQNTWVSHRGLWEPPS